METVAVDPIRGLGISEWKVEARSVVVVVVER